MFDKITHHNEEETSFSEAYRSEILDKGKTKEESLLPKLFSVLLLIVLISAISIFGYKYFNNSKHKTNITDEINKKNEPTPIVKKKVIQEKKEEITQESLPTESMMITNFEELEIIEAAQTKKVNPTPIATKNDIDQIANQMKLELAREIDVQNSIPQKKQEESTSVTPQKGEEIYMKQLRDLSEEIDREGK